MDAPTRVLGLATRTALDAAELPLALRRLLGRCTIRSVPAVSPSGRPTGRTAPVEGALEQDDTVMLLRDPHGGVITVERAYLPFTPTEFARARALVELDALLGPRVPAGQDVLTLPEGAEITVRRADQGDLAAARAMHDRCSERTLGLRYHGPVADADRYLDHLLSPRFGRTLAVETASGRLVALGHLLWDRGRDRGGAARGGRLAGQGHRLRAAAEAGRPRRRGRLRPGVRGDPGVQHRDGRRDARD